jgi:PAS domain S-box-containing protein
VVADVPPFLPWAVTPPLTTDLTALIAAAVRASARAIAITDARLPDQPLVWVNPAFTETTGYEPDEAVGRNCRFLQGPLTSADAVTDIRRAIAARTTLTTTILNYRKDGTQFWNELSLAPIVDERGEVTHFVGVQADVSDRVEAEQARDAALRRAEDASLRLTMLASFMRELAATDDVDASVELLARFLLPRVATWCAVYLLDEGERSVTPRIYHSKAHRSPEIAQRVASMQDVPAGWYPGDGPVREILTGQRHHFLAPRLTAETVDFAAVTGARYELFRSLGSRSVLVVPMAARRKVIGALAVMADKDRRPFGADDLQLVVDLANRTALMVETLERPVR